MDVAWTAAIGLWLVVYFHTGHSEEYQQANYTGCQFVSVKPKTVEELKIVLRLYTANVAQMDFPEDDNFSQLMSEVSHPVSIPLCSNANQSVEEQLQNISYTLNIQDIQQLIDEQASENELLGRFDPATGSIKDFAVDQYHTFKEIQHFYQVAAQEYADLMTLETIGTTLYGNPLQMLKVTDGSSNGTKDVIWVDSGTHSREWVAIASLLYVIKQLLVTNDSLSHNLLKDFDFYFLPVVNPDGYLYTWTNDRLWRKNRSKGNNFCIGVDLNRNFDINFKGGFLSNFACSQEYKGPTPFSEKETRAMRDQLMAIKDRMKVFISLHSFGQMWLSPYGYQKSRPKDYQSILSMSQLIVKAINRVNGQHYKTGSVNEQLYNVNGCSVDWVYDVLGVKYSYAVELRDTGRFGFLLPRNQIVPTAQELMTALQVIVDNINNSHN